MEKKLSIYVIFLCMLMGVTACSTARLNPDKLSTQARADYDRFYQDKGEQIDREVLKDFDVKFMEFNAVYDPQKDIVGILIALQMYPKTEKRIQNVHLALAAPCGLKGKIQGMDGQELYFADTICMSSEYVSYIPYESIPTTGAGVIFYSHPLQSIQMTKDEFIQHAREVTVELHFKDGKEESKAFVYKEEPVQWEAVLDPHGGQGALFFRQ